MLGRPLRLPHEGESLEEELDWWKEGQLQDGCRKMGKQVSGSYKNEKWMDLKVIPEVIQNFQDLVGRAVRREVKWHADFLLGNLFKEEDNIKHSRLKRENYFCLRNAELYVLVRHLAG